MKVAIPCGGEGTRHREEQGVLFFEPELLDRYLNDLDSGPLQRLADGRWMLRPYGGLWQPLDNFPERKLLEGDWNSTQASWKVRE